MISALTQTVAAVTENPKAQLTAVGAMISLRFDWLPQTANETASWVGVAVGLTIFTRNILKSRKIHLENKILQHRVDNQDLPTASRRCTDNKVEMK